MIPVVNRVSFTIKPTEIVGYLGPNGAGKSTTIKMLAGLLESTDGQILYNGKNIRKDLYTYKKRIGYVPENAEIYPHLSGYDYLLMVGRLRQIPEKPLKKRIKQLLELFKLSVEMDLAISSYSNGMIQKVLIASALLHDPDVLLLDEPLSGLDVTTSLVIKDLLKLLAEDGKIIMYSSHILEVVEKICSRAIIIHKGRIVADDSVENLRNLMKLPSLEEIFSQLVVQEDTAAQARGIIAAIRS
ncbi:MAG: ATP-binding cassette domain-containing protein [Candidatus Aminicenantes bacterium]|nr:ATP-binding cassette domain-containing protein [Candidatus Aminicenantes bacterium]